MYKFHKKKSVDVDVDLIRVGLTVSPSGDDENEDSEKSENGDPPEVLARDIEASANLSHIGTDLEEEIIEKN